MSAGPPEPVREIVLLLPVPRAQALARQVAVLMEAWRVENVSDAITRAVAEAAERVEADAP